MQITIVVEDKTVICDGFAVPLPALDWAKFDGDPSTPWDDIQAVQYNTDEKQGHVEYRTIVTQPAVRPNIRPGDRHITSAEFNAEFAWVLDAYEEGKMRLIAAAAKAKEEAARAAELAYAKAEADRKAAIERASLPQDAFPVDGILERMAALEAENTRLKQRVAANEEAVIDAIKGGAG